MTAFTMGCDPEFYVTRSSTGQRISAHELVPGTKKEPHKLPSGGYVQADGVAVEFNIPPASTSKEFVDGVKGALSDIRKMIDSKYTFNFLPYTSFGEIYFKKLPDAVKELGCDPDFNAYTGGQQPSPSLSADKPYRAFGGHLHFGWGSKLEGDGHFNDCCSLVKGMEYYPMYPYYFEIGEEETKRRRLYGQGGSFRPKPYGVEWRSPSNAWLAAGEVYWSYMFNKCQYIFDRMRGHGLVSLTCPTAPRANTQFTM